MTDLDTLFARLNGSRFRRGVRLPDEDLVFLHAKGLDVVLAHASRFMAERLAPADPQRDGRQTPWHGHPVFVAQHATATCCRGCLAKWHAIEQGRPLSDDEQQYVASVLGRWLAAYLPPEAEPHGRTTGGQQATLW